MPTQAVARMGPGDRACHLWYPVSLTHQSWSDYLKNGHVPNKQHILGWADDKKGNLETSFFRFPKLIFWFSNHSKESGWVFIQALRCGGPSIKTELNGWTRDVKRSPNVLKDQTTTKLFIPIGLHQLLTALLVLDNILLRFALLKKKIHLTKWDIFYLGWVMSSNGLFIPDAFKAIGSRADRSNLVLLGHGFETWTSRSYW